MDTRESTTQNNVLTETVSTVMRRRRRRSRLKPLGAVATVKTTWF